MLWNAGSPFRQELLKIVVDPAWFQWPYLSVLLGLIKNNGVETNCCILCHDVLRSITDGCKFQTGLQGGLQGNEMILVLSPVSPK